MPQNPNRQISDEQEQAMVLARGITELLRDQVTDSKAAIKQSLWRNETATVRYQAMTIDGNLTEFTVANQRGPEDDTVEVTYERTALPGGSEVENLEAQDGLEARRTLSGKELFFLQTVDQAMQEAFREQ